MRIALTFFMLLLVSGISSADVIFEEHFTDGSIQDGWFSPWPEGQDIVITPDPTAPSGDGWVGSVAGDQASTALNGTMDLDDYTVESWVYTIVSNDVMFPMYNAVAARWDTTNGNSYYYFTSQFGQSKKLRLRRYPGSGFGAETFLEWTGADIPGGEPTESGWHKMTLRVSGDEIWCYWDDQLLSGCPYLPNEEFRQYAGFFGIYEFYMGDQVTEPETRFDDFVVTDENNDVDEITIAPVPNTSIVSSLYPNPFNASTTVTFTNSVPGNVTLAVFDVLGRQMTTLQHGFLSPGDYRVTWDANGYSTGNYFITVQLGDKQVVHRAVLTK
ncbi:T9SS type A sorting domain-containing protein [bacterium]|nr:T9SS type A sorting domain-containing protein [bacterium]